MSAIGFFALNLGIMFSLAHDFTDAYLNIEGKVAERTKDLAVANEELRALDRMKERFFANVSHDFKTPIAVAFAHIEQAKAQATGETAQGLDAAEKALNRLQGMVQDVLDGLRAEAGQLKLRWQLTRPGTLVPAWVTSYGMLCSKKGLAFRVENKVGPALAVPMDPAPMERVVANLVSNAIKFTENGSVIVELSTTEKDLLIQVADTGPGIPKPEREKVFDRYYQGFNTALRDHGGSGIGLSFVKEVVDLHNGRIWIDDNPGGGSVFCVALPLSQDVEITGEYDPEREAIRIEPLKGSLDVPYPAAEPPKLDPARPNVLIVEDNPEIAQAVFNSLRNDFNLHFARHGEDALALLARVRIDGVLSDLMMPVMDGTELLRRMRSAPKTRGIPVVILSSKGEASDVVEHLRLGAQDYVAKPFRKDVLLARLRAQIERRKLYERLLATDKMVTLGLLSSGVAHEIRNPLGRALSAVSALSETLRSLPDLSGGTADPAAFLSAFRDRNDRLTRAIDLASRALAQIHRVVDAMRGFASGSLERVEVNLAEALAEAATLVDGKAKKRRISVSIQAPTPRKILGYPTLHQVFVNLLDNAIDASPEGGGTVTATAEATEAGARVTVEDRGSGIQPELLPHIFDPFVTTKPPESGTGLGLFLVKQIVELQHAGKVHVRSTVGRGTAFVVELPAEAPPMDIEGFKPFHGFDLRVA